jgi:hypothetical protein
MLGSTHARIAVSLAMVALVAGCGSGGGSSSPLASKPASSPATSTPEGSAPAASPPAVAACDTDPWRSAPITVTHSVSVPPVPVVKAVRVAQHPECGYDRVVLDFGGAVPTYSVRYVDRVVADASGQPIALPGARYLLITLRPAQAHDNAGTPTVTTSIQQPRFPALASWAIAGDVEGVVTIALGLAGQTSIRTGELPGRIYIDVRE